ncbi:hypothetical protein V6Z11_A03G084700 [Gossypium hirsutum]
MTHHFLCQDIKGSMFNFRVSLGVCRNILRMCRDVEFSLGILLFCSLCFNIACSMLQPSNQYWVNAPLNGLLHTHEVYYLTLRPHSTPKVNKRLKIHFLLDLN